ncbi:MAG: R3H domain-containing nucleic acid-binding protein [bacterium]
MEKNDPQKIKFVEETLTRLLELLQIEADFAVGQEKAEGEDRPLIKIDLEGADLGILIGYHGETLSSLQHFIILSLYREYNEWFQVVLDIGGYRQEQEERLKIIAKKVADRALFEQQPIHMQAMPPFERKVIHTALAGIEGVKSESEGEGRERHIVVSPQ